MGGRIADIAVDPRGPETWYVAVGSGGVWKTTDGGVTCTPVFDDQPLVLDRLRDASTRTNPRPSGSARART